MTIAAMPGRSTRNPRIYPDPRYQRQGYGEHDYQAQGTPAGAGHSSYGYPEQASQSRDFEGNESFQGPAGAPEYASRPEYAGAQGPGRYNGSRYDDQSYENRSRKPGLC